MSVTQGTWGAISPLFNYDFGVTEKLPFAYTNKATESALVNPNQPSPAYNIMGQPNFSVPTNTVASTPNNQGGDVLGADKNANQQKQPSGGSNNNNSGGGIDWGAGLTGEQVRALGMNPDAMVATNGKYYGSNGGGNGGSSVDWDAAYNPVFSALSQLENYLQSSSQTSKGNIEQDYGSNRKNILDEQGNLQSGLAEQQRQLGESGRSAASEALRSYNALMQQNLSRYGLGTGAGSFLSDLVNQEYMRTKGGIGQQMQSGQNQLAIEGQKTQQYISKKLGDLDSWKRDAFKTIDDNLQSRLYEIGTQRGGYERDKAAQKQAALTDALNYKREVEANDKSFRMNLAQFAVQNLQNVTGQTYTPQEIAKIVSEMMSATIAPMTGQDNSVVYNPFTASQKKNTDEYGNPIQ